MLTILGGCLCGRVRFKILSKPLYVYYCHCTLCRKASGTVASAWLTIPASSYFQQGELLVYKSSSNFERRFCGNCGTQIVFARQKDPEFLEISHGSLDEPEKLPPNNHIWLRNKLHYLELNQQLPGWETEPSEEN